jgi:hypothetical protein
MTRGCAPRRLIFPPLFSRLKSMYDGEALERSHDHYGLTTSFNIALGEASAAISIIISSSCCQYRSFSVGCKHHTLQMSHPGNPQYWSVPNASGAYLHLSSHTSNPRSYALSARTKRATSSICLEINADVLLHIVSCEQRGLTCQRRRLHRRAELQNSLRMMTGHNFHIGRHGQYLFLHS